MPCPTRWPPSNSEELGAPRIHTMVMGRAFGLSSHYPLLSLTLHPRTPMPRQQLPSLLSSTP